MSEKKYYTIYLRSTDEVVAFGDSDTCAHMMNRSKDSFFSMIQKNRSGKHKKYIIVSEPFHTV